MSETERKVCSTCGSTTWILGKGKRKEEVFLAEFDGNAGEMGEFHHPETGKTVRWMGEGPEWRGEKQERANPELYEEQLVEYDIVTPCPNCRPFEFAQYQKNDLTQKYLRSREPAKKDDKEKTVQSALEEFGHKAKRK